MRVIARIRIFLSNGSSNEKSRESTTRVWTRAHSVELGGLAVSLF